MEEKGTEMKCVGLQQSLARSVDYEDYAATSEKYDDTRVTIGLEIIVGCLAIGRRLDEQVVLAGISHVAPFSQVGVARNRSKGKSDGFCHQNHARQHEIESEWDMVAFDIAGRAVPRTPRSCRLHA